MSEFEEMAEEKLELVEELADEEPVLVEEQDEDPVPVEEPVEEVVVEEPEEEQEDGVVRDARGRELVRLEVGGRVVEGWLVRVEEFAVVEVRSERGEQVCGPVGGLERVKRG